METGDVAVIPVLESVSRDSIGLEFDETLGVCNFMADGETLLIAGVADGTDGVGFISLGGEQCSSMAPNLAVPMRFLSAQ